MTRMNALMLGTFALLGPTGGCDEPWDPSAETALADTLPSQEEVFGLLTPGVAPTDASDAEQTELAAPTDEDEAAIWKTCFMSCHNGLATSCYYDRIPEQCSPCGGCAGGNWATLYEAPYTCACSGQGA